MKTHVQLLFLSLFALSTLACGGDKEEGEQEEPKKREDVSKPVATGGPYDLIIVTSEQDWESEIGDKLREIYGQGMPGLTMNEPYFEVIHLSPLNLSNMIKRGRNMIYAFRWNDNGQSGQKMKSYFTKGSLEELQADPDRHQVAQRDTYARGQDIIYVFGQDKADLVQYLEESKDDFRSFFLERERKRQLERLDLMDRSNTVEAALENLLGVKMKLPLGYRIVTSDEDFAWMRVNEGRQQRHLVIFRTSYEDPSVFQADSLKALRHRALGSRIFGDPEEPDSYMRIQDRAQVVYDTIRFQGDFAVEMRGLWRTNTEGGSFISYTFPSKDRQSLYYIEGFVYYPNEEKRQIIRELEASLWSFEEVE